MIWTFEILRIYLLICVMFTHLAYLAEPYYDRFSVVMSFGTAGVYYFFILSACFLYFTFKKYAPKNEREAVRLVLKRTMQYFVLYWMKLIAVVLYYFILIFYSHINTFSILDVLKEFLVKFLMIDVYVPLGSPDPGWYFRSLFFCYLIAYPIYRLVKKLNEKQRFAGILLCFAVHFVLDFIFRDTAYEWWKIVYNPYIHSFDFFIGMSIARTIDERREKGITFTSKVIPSVLELIALLLIIIAQFIMPDHLPVLMRYHPSVYLVIMSFVVYAFAHNAGVFSLHGKDHKLLSWLHRHFFSLYIFHDIAIKYSLLVPWSSSKYLNLAGAVIAIIVLDELILLPLSKKIADKISQHID